MPKEDKQTITKKEKWSDMKFPYLLNDPTTIAFPAKLWKRIARTLDKLEYEH